MAWAGPHGDRYRVRYRDRGRLVVDGSFIDREVASARIARLNVLDRAARQTLTAASPPTLSQWVSAWLPAHLAGPATTAKYRSMLRNHILPTFGGHRLNAITRNEVKAFARDLAGRRSPTTVRSIVTLLGLVLRDAIDEHYLFFDPTARLRLREGPAEPRPTVTPAEVWRIAQRMLDTHSRMLVFTAAYTGMRFGELAGLRRCNVHLDRAVSFNVITVTAVAALLAAAALMLLNHIGWRVSSAMFDRERLILGTKG